MVAAFFPEPGVYNISVIVQDNDGLTQSNYTIVTVLDVPDVVVISETTFGEGFGNVDYDNEAQIFRNVNTNAELIEIHISIFADNDPQIETNFDIYIKNPAGANVFAENRGIMGSGDIDIHFNVTRSQLDGKTGGNWMINLVSKTPPSDFSYQYQWYEYYPPSLIGDQESLTITATVKDTDSLSHTFTWNSNLDGDLGTTNPITIPPLSVGQHKLQLQQRMKMDWKETIRFQLMLVKLQLLTLLVFLT